MVGMRIVAATLEAAFELRGRQRVTLPLRLRHFNEIATGCDRPLATQHATGTPDELIGGWRRAAARRVEMGRAVSACSAAGSGGAGP